MRILRSIFLFSFLFFASNQCDAAIFDFDPFEVNEHPHSAENTDINDSYSLVNSVQFYQRTEQVSNFQPTGQEIPDQLFLRFGKIENFPNNLIPAFLNCISIGLILIFPKHYFY